MAKDANEQNVLDLSNMDNVDWTAIANGNPVLAEQLQQMAARTKFLEAKVEAQATEKKVRDSKTVIEKLEAALTREPKGINRDAVDFVMTGISPAGTADPKEMLAVIAKGLEMCPGVVVDLDTFELDPHIVQLWLTVYNLNESRSITPAKPRKGEANENGAGDEEDGAEAQDAA